MLSQPWQEGPECCQPFKPCFIQMPCLSHSSCWYKQGVYPSLVSLAPAAVQKEFLLSSHKRLSQKVKMRMCSFCLPGQRTRSQKPWSIPATSKWERKDFYYLGKSCKWHLDLQTGLLLPAQKSQLMSSICQPIFCWLLGRVQGQCRTWCHCQQFLTGSLWQSCKPGKGSKKTHFTSGCCLLPSTNFYLGFSVK